MIYFDNAATGFFKPQAVIDAVGTVVKYLSANPGRSGHRLSIAGARTVQSAREVLADYFNASFDRVIFTKNCTEALNLAILGSLKKCGHVITTAYEHNSVLRPLSMLNKKGDIELSIVSPNKNLSIEQAIEKAIKPNTYMIVCSSASNVTGQVLPIKKIGNIAKKHGLLFLVDGAQGGGHYPISVKDMNISFLALACHKGLYGIMGSGALILSDAVDLEPIITGGTGSESLSLDQPLCYPERLEAGTLNLPAIAGLLEGAKYIKSNERTFSNHLYSYTEHMIKKLNDIEGVKVYSSPNVLGIVSFDTPKDSADFADLLNSEFDVAVRGGLHCAPLMHKLLGTEDRGLVRASLAVQNSTREIDYFVNAVKKLCCGN